MNTPRRSLGPGPRTTPAFPTGEARPRLLPIERAEQGAFLTDGAHDADADGDADQEQGAARRRRPLGIRGEETATDGR